MRQGTLWQAVLDTTDSAIASGALERIPTRMSLVEEEGIRFQVHIVQQLERKRRAKITQRRTGTNPFLPYEEALFVAHISDTHVCLLNKFNVMDHHLLLVTRAFEDQETLLTQADFEAMWLGLREFDSLAFYNSGEVAGASQPHKHLQQVPLPLGGGRGRTPVEALMAGATFHGTLGTVDAFPFVHAVARVGHLKGVPPGEAAAATESVYLEMLGHPGPGQPLPPYNLLVTQDWMLFVPRSVERYGPISVNALGFAGSLLARDEGEATIIRERGPLGILTDVGLKDPTTDS